MHSFSLFFAAVAAVTLPAVDPARIEAEMAADTDVLKSLQENGDDPTIARNIDVRFVGRRKSIAILRSAIAGSDWHVVQMVSVDSRNYALDIQRHQTTDAVAIRDLTEAALRIEQQYEVRYDGWGTVATKR
jgi:regulator of RNase E activity RraB